MSAREIRRLKNKFILIALFSIFMAMLFIGLAVNIVTSCITSGSVKRVLDVMVDNYDENHENIMDYTLDDPNITDIFAPEYEHNQYFLFVFDANQQLVSSRTNISNEAYTTSVSALAQEILSNRHSRGRERNFFYKRVEQEDGQIVVAMLEGSVLIATEYRMLYLTLALGFLGMLITFFLVRHFSEKAIQPEIEASMRQKEFITNASHELKTPLAVIRANTEMMEVLNGESEWTTSTLRQVDHLSGLIQNLVMITRSQEKENKSELSKVDASRAVNESVDPYELLASQSGKTIERSIAPEVQIVADESKIRQLSALLIDNAIKYCDEGGTIRVELESIKSGLKNNGLRLIVSNDYAEGANIDVSRFFDRFYREDQSHNQDKGGYGIGLSIAEGITHQYKGSIDVKWEDGVISFVCIMK